MASLYFAYGSNMDGSQMAKRCPGAIRVDPVAVLHDHRLAFAGYSKSRGGGVATVIPTAGSMTPGVVYLVDPEHIESLDRYEGHPFSYTRSTTTVSLGGMVRQATIYIKRDTTPGAPTDAYLDKILRAYRRLGIGSEDVVAAALDAEERQTEAEARDVAAIYEAPRESFVDAILEQYPCLLDLRGRLDDVVNAIEAAYDLGWRDGITDAANGCVVPDDEEIDELRF